MRRGYVDTVDGQIHYRDQGTGSVTYVLIHQALRSSLEYRRVAARLERGARVISVDLLGCGDSDLTPEQYTVPRHAERIADLLKVLDLRDVCVVGHHTGGNVAMAVAADHTERVGSVVLSGPAFVMTAEERDSLVRKMSAIQYPEPQSDGSHLLPIWNEGRISSFDVPRIPDSEPELLHDFFIEQIKVGPRRKEAHIAAFSHDAVGTLARITLPTLIIVGLEDMWACCRWEEMLAIRPEATCIRLETAGEAPRLMSDTFADAIAGFCAGLPSAGE